MNAQKRTAITEKKYEGLTDEERAAMKERASGFAPPCGS